MPGRERRLPGGQPGNSNAVKHGFYSKQLSEEHGADYLEAIELTGLSEEIALLRVHIARVVADGADMADLVKGVDVLLRAVATEHRISDKAKESLADSVADVLERVGGQLGIGGLNG